MWPRDLSGNVFEYDLGVLNSEFCIISFIYFLIQIFVFFIVGRSVGRSVGR